LYTILKKQKTEEFIVGVVEMKPVRELLWVKEQRPLTTVPMGDEAGIPMTHQPMDPFHKESSELLLQPLYQCSLDVCFQLESMALLALS
jgi:hypothetical protein